jgi:hypothetical protein
MRQLLRSYRWWAALAGLALVILVGRWGYFLTMPMEGWLSRGWYAMHDGWYAMAEACFTRASEKQPSSHLPRVALAALYTMQIEQPGKRRKFGPLQRVPGAGDYLDAKEQQRIAEEYETAHGWLNAQQAWFGAHFGAVAAEMLFDAGWTSYPGETARLIDAMAAACAGRAPAAWTAFHTLETGSPRGFAHLANADPRFLYYYADVAWRTGRGAEARRILALPAAKLMPYQLNASWRAQVLARSVTHNYAMPPDAGARARVWAVRADGLQDTGLTEPDRDVAWTVLPGRAGAHLITVLHTRQTPLADALGWWQWGGGAWQSRSVSDRQAMVDAVMRGPLPAARVDEPLTGYSAWSSARECLALRGTAYGSHIWKLVELRRGATLVPGCVPRELAIIDGLLWVHDLGGFTRLDDDGSSEQYRGATVTQVGALFGGAETRRIAFAVNDAWRMAHDGAGTLWLVAWNGIDLSLRARWDGAAFRPPTTAEQSAARGGLLDSAGRLWRPGELPRGFQRDAWRTAPGQPRLADPAVYAVDARGRAWVVCGTLAARWDGGRWVSVANRLPGPGPSFTSGIATGKGVVITMPGAVAYLE